MEIVLLRHGKPDIQLKGMAQANEIAHHLSRYDQAPVTETPPSEAINIALTCDAVICSSLIRSHHSATALGLTEIHVFESLFDEIAMPHYKNGSLILPLHAWGIIYRLMSLVGFSHNGESYGQAKQRAKQAVAKLTALAAKNRRTLLIGHGFMNHFIAKELRKQNWQGPGSPGKKHWSFSLYKKIN